MALSNTPTRLTPPTALTSTSADLYTSPAGSGLTAVIRNIHLSNTTGADRSVTLGIGSLATPANLILSTLVVPANDAISLDVYIGMNAAEVLKGLCSLSGGITVTIMGVL